jgi:L-threonylcarbamoyladenylate synthase
METTKARIIDAAERNVQQQAVRLLKGGSLVAFPTDTVYGLAAHPWDADAVKQLYEVKQRPTDMPIPLLLSDAEEVHQVATLPTRCAPLIRHFWPGGLTLVLPKKPIVSDAISSRPTVAVRVPDLSLTQELIRAAGGVLAVTSANISGQASPVTAQEVEQQLGDQVGLIVDGGTCQVGVPSTIIDCSISPPKILRRGAIDEEELQSVIGEISSPE